MSENLPTGVDFDALTRAATDDFQRRVAQDGGGVPRSPFVTVTNPDGTTTLHELVEEDVRSLLDRDRRL